MNRWLIGMPGMGKSEFAANEIRRDMKDGNIVVVFDPNGDLTDTALLHCPKKRARDVLIIDPTDSAPAGFNPFEGIRNKAYTAELLKDTVKVLAGYEHAPTPVMERVLFNSIATLLETKGSSILDLEPLLTDKEFRSDILKDIKDSYLLRKWEHWQGKKDRDWEQLIGSTENKAGDFSEDPRLRRVLAKSTFDLSTLLFDGQPIILLRLPQLELGSKARSFGSLFLAYLMAVVARRGIAPPINVYIDDCDVFDTPVLRKLVVQSRRLNLSVTLINQYLDQLSTDLRTSLLGSAQIRVMFRCGIEDSAYLHKSLPTDNNAPLLHQLDPYQAIYFDGRSNRIEDIKGKPLPRGNVKTARELVEQSRRRYGLVAGK